MHRIAASVKISHMTPAVFGLPIAELALLIAGASFLVSVIALVWQVAKHLLDGGRVRVQLNPAIWEPGVKLVTNRDGRFPMPDLLKVFGTSVMPEYFEVAQLVVENPGRIAVTVSAPSLRVGGTGQKRYSVTPRMFAVPGMGEDTAVKDTVYRIEPYDRVTFIFDIWPSLTRLRNNVARTITLRGAIQVPGRRNLRLSSWGTAWRVPPECWTLREGLSEISPRTVMWRAGYRTIHGLSDGPNRLPVEDLRYVLFAAMRMSESEPTPQELADALDTVIGQFRDGMQYKSHKYMARSMIGALDAERGHLGGHGRSNRTGLPTRYPVPLVSHLHRLSALRRLRDQE